MLFYYSRDVSGCQAWYGVKAVIEYQGSLSSQGVSQGHYICDVQNKNTWFRTNDDSYPAEITESEVSRNFEFQPYFSIPKFNPEHTSMELIK